jgi:transposase-like protein
VLSERYFHNEDAAYGFCESRLWPDGPVCPHCRIERGKVGKLKGRSTRRGTYKCYTCLRPFTVKIGTVFESSHLELHLWLQAIYLISFARKKITVRELQQTLGIGLKTAWVLNSRIRERTTRGDGLPAVVDKHRYTVIREALESAKAITADRREAKPPGTPTYARTSPELQRPEARESKPVPSEEPRKGRSRPRQRPSDPNQLTLFKA